MWYLAQRKMLGPGKAGEPGEGADNVGFQQPGGMLLVCILVTFKANICLLV